MDANEIIEELETLGRELEIKWQASTQQEKQPEAEKPFKPSFSNDIWSKEK